MNTNYFRRPIEITLQNAPKTVFTRRIRLCAPTRVVRQLRIYTHIQHKHTLYKIYVRASVVWTSTAPHATLELRNIKTYTRLSRVGQASRRRWRNLESRRILQMWWWKCMTCAHWRFALFAGRRRVLCMWSVVNGKVNVGESVAFKSSQTKSQQNPRKNTAKKQEYFSRHNKNQIFKNRHNFILYFIMLKKYTHTT